MDETTPLADWFALDRQMKEITSRPAFLPPQALSAEQAAVLAALDQDRTVPDLIDNQDKVVEDILDKLCTDLPRED